MVASEAVRLLHARKPPLQGKSYGELLNALPDGVAEHGGKKALWRAYLQEVSVQLTPFGLGRTPPPSTADTVRFVSQGGALSLDDWWRVVLLLGLSPLKFLLVRRQPLEMLSTIVSELSVQWCDNYAAWPSLFDGIASLPRAYGVDAVARDWSAAILQTSDPAPR